nr:hypothetical protein [Leptolyngbyaceae cyanobacterium MAG.088]
MASITLTKVKAVGADFPNNTEPEFRFDSNPIARITVPVPGVWVNFPFVNTVNFSDNGKITLFFHGMFISASNTTVNETPGRN